MRSIDQGQYPHPVLETDSEDFAEGEFDISFDVVEEIRASNLELNHRITLTEPEIRSLIESGEAVAGCFVHCAATYYTGLHRLTWPAGSMSFSPGSLLDRVVLHPLIWLERAVSSWSPGTAHSEFELPLDLPRASILARGEIKIISVGPEKLASLESIFELARAEKVAPGRLTLDLQKDRISILAPPELYDTISLLRGYGTGPDLLMSAVYLPVVMETLDALRQGSDEYLEFRWHRAFTARCDARGISCDPGTSLLDDAQELLDGPAARLNSVVRGME